MKFKPKKIRYKDIVVNKPIKNKTEIIGFLVIIINIPKKIDIIAKISNIWGENPLVRSSKNTYLECM